MTGSYWSSITQGAKSRGISIEMTKSDAWERFSKQGGCCALTGLEISFQHPQTASLDRIDSKLPYAVDNIQWVHKDINRMKNAFPQAYFIRMCKLVAEGADMNDRIAA